MCVLQKCKVTYSLWGEDEDTDSVSSGTSAGVLPSPLSSPSPPSSPRFKGARGGLGGTGSQLHPSRLLALRSEASRRPQPLQRAGSGAGTSDEGVGVVGLKSSPVLSGELLSCAPSSARAVRTSSDSEKMVRFAPHIA